MLSPSRRFTTKKQRLIFLAIGVVLLGISATLVLTALEDNLLFFYTPTMLQEKKPDTSRPLRLGGLVEKNSIQRLGESRISFTVTDNKTKLTVFYQGILPALFREGQGVVAEGTLGKDGSFQATSVLAKHDENYMPPDMHDALKNTSPANSDTLEGLRP